MALLKLDLSRDFFLFAKKIKQNPRRALEFCRENPPDQRTGHFLRPGRPDAATKAAVGQKTDDLRAVLGGIEGILLRSLFVLFCLI